MATLKSIARPYAYAIYKFSVFHNSIDSWKTMLKYMVNISNHEKIKKIILSKFFLRQIEKIFISICGEKIDKYAQNFIKILAQNKRLILLESIYIEFISLCDIYENITHITVFSAYILTQNQLDNINKIFEKKLSKKINIKCKIKKDLIDGFVIKYNDMVINLSIQYQLKRLLYFLQR
ncbi:MAG: F0F1 ATP synthase subunit delta [Buchnera aphidicola (Nurudea yanoniella)]